MEESIIAAVQERLELGHTEEQILSELQEKGYSAELAERYLAAAQPAGLASSSIIPDAPTSPAPAPVTTAPSDYLSAKSTLSTPSSSTAKHSIWPAVIIGLLLSAALFGGYWLYKQVNPVNVTALFGAAPYSTEEDFTRGVLLSLRELSAHSFNLDYGITFAPREPETLVLNTEWAGDLEDLAELAGFTIPDEGFARFSAAGLTDIRDRENPEFDVTMQGSVMIEPIAMSAAGALRLTDQRLYGRIDDLPVSELFAGEFMDDELMEFPLETWVLLLDIVEIEESFRDQRNDFIIPNLPQVLNNDSLYLEQFAELLVPQPEPLAVASTDWMDNLSASVNQAFGLSTVTDDEAEAEAIALAVAESLADAPPFVFAGEPVTVERDGERLHEYTIHVTRDRLLSFMDMLAQKLPDATDSVSAADIEMIKEELEEELPTAEAFNMFNEFVGIVYSVRTDGGVAGWRVESTFTSPREEVKGQVEFLLEMMVSPQNDGLDITEPTDVHPKSLQEMEDARREQQRLERYDSSVEWQLRSLRFDADTYYADQQNSYAGLCAADAVTELVEPTTFYSEPITDLVCGATSEVYVVYAPYRLESGFYCVDSTGYAWRIADADGQDAQSCAELELSGEETTASAPVILDI